jgi:hypothetical protein
MPTNTPLAADTEGNLPTTIVEEVSLDHDDHHNTVHKNARNIWDRVGFAQSTSDIAANASTDDVWTKRSDGTTGFEPPTGGGGGASFYQAVQDESASPLTPRSKVSFQGAGVTATDDGANDRTIVTIPSAAATTFPRPGLYVVYSSDWPAALRTSDATYDSLCDGISDEVQINAAITAAAATRGDVKLLGLLYKIRAPILRKTGVKLGGLGWDVTRIEVDTTGWVGDRMIGLADVNQHATELCDLWFDGKNIGTASGLRDLNTGGSFTGSPSTSPDATHSVHDCRFYNNPGKGFWLEGNSRGSNYNNIYILGSGEQGLRCESVDCDLYGFQIGSAGDVGAYLAAGNTRYSHFKIWFSDSHGVQISTANRWELSNFESQDNLGSGYHITSGKGRMSGCTADSNSYDGSPSGAITGRSFYGFNFVSVGSVIAQALEAYDKNEGGRGARQLYGYFFNAATVNSKTDGTSYGNFTGSVGGTRAASVKGDLISGDGF